MKTQLIPVLITALLAGPLAHARDRDDSDRDQTERHQSGRAQAQAQQQPQAQPQQQPQAQPQQPPQPQPWARPRESQRDRGGPQGSAAGQNNHWIPGDPNRPSAPRGNPLAGGQGTAAPAPAAPRTGGNGAQGSGQPASERYTRGSRPENPNWQAERARGQVANQQRQSRDGRSRDWRADRGWFDRYRVEHFRYRDGRYFARQRYALGAYSYPRGYATRLWLAGDWLPSAFYFDGRYALNNYWFYDLYEPPLDCYWIRVGNDALLVDEVSGEVLDVVYDLFW